jgi:hypothetical protein
MTSAVSSVAFGVARVVIVTLVLIVIVAVVALVVARYLARTKRARQGVFLGVSCTGLVFVAFLAWSWLSAVR